MRVGSESMRKHSFICFLKAVRGFAALFAAAGPIGMLAQNPEARLKPGSRSTPAANVHMTVLRIVANADCQATNDGKQHIELKLDVAQRTRIAMGRHLLLATGSHGEGTQQQVFQVLLTDFAASQHNRGGNFSQWNLYFSPLYLP